MEAEIRSQPHPVYDFGEFRLDASRRLLFAKGANDALPVTPKIIAALLLLIEHEGELLTKDQLMAGLWPGRIVEENSLTQLISVLRHVLGEEPGENRYVATVPGFGYRFIADVSRHSDSPEPPVSSQEITATADARPRVAVVALTGALGAVLLTYGWYAQWRPVDEAPAPPPPAIELPSRTVAVLPFENLSADDGNEYIAFGVAESVLHRLAKIPNLTVIARTSSFVFRDRATDARDIGRALNARYLLEGSLQHANERVRVIAQLIDATTGGHVWSLRFDRTLADIFSVEDEIAQGVAQALQVSLEQPEHPYARFGIDAYLSYLQGQTLLATHRSDDAERAIEHFRRAIEIAPNFGAGHAALADAMWQVLLKVQTAGMGELHRARTAREQQLLEAGVREVQPVLERALELDDRLAEAYILRADLKNVMDDPVGAEADYRKGLSLRPNYSKGHLHLSILLYGLVGREEETLAELERAILLDPLMPRAYYVKGHYEVFTVAEEGGTAIEGERYIRQALARAPDYHPALLLLGRIRWYQGRFAEAAMLAERALAVDPRVQWTRRVLAEIYLDVGELDASRSVLLEAPATVPPIYWLATCLYEQRPEQAAELLRADPARDGFIDADTPAYVLRDAAKASGHPEHGLTELLKRGPDPYGLYRGPEPYALMTVAHLNFVLGDRAESERNARRLLEPDYDPYGFNRRILAVPKAAALTLLGDHDAAIDLLEDHGRFGFGWRWWYTFDRDPVFDALRADPRFQALAAEAHAHAEAERERLRIMRERGQVPTRLADGTPGPQGC